MKSSCDHPFILLNGKTFDSNHHNKCPRTKHENKSTPRYTVPHNFVIFDQINDGPFFAVSRVDGIEVIQCPVGPAEK